MAFDFTGKRVWVTGAGRGIGREVALAFAGALAAAWSVIVAAVVPAATVTGSAGSPREYRSRTAS